ncbi:sensor histidine kinase [uncultured Catenibacterium sp.]|uniref:sensor histidine kinase n=2 Tax=uncultured Catenibacterium sp. TaxID=286142 RepID=UPI0025D3876C|nr:sensor histidine kinase [uncultured Catenibacterium sp.]
MKNKKLSVRIILPIIMSVSIATCIISSMMLFSYLFSSYFKRDAIEKVNRQINSLSQSIENEINTVNNLVNDIYYQDIKKYDCGSAQFTTVMNQKMSNETNRIYSLSLYDMNGNSIWQYGEIENSSVINKTWFKNAKRNIETIQYDKRKLVQPDLSGYVMDVSRYVEYIDHGHMKSGILLMQYYTEPIEDILDRYSNQMSAYCYLMDESNNFLYHPFELRMASGLYKENTVSYALKSKNYTITDIKNENYLIERKQIGYTGWNIVVVNSMSNLAVENKRFHYIIWLILLLVGAILILFDVQVFRNFTDPVYQLLNTMEEFGQGDYEARAKEEGIGELKNLSANFNIMADQLQKQMEEIRRNEREKQKMEKKLLQSQINPHFLYNTLDSIIWMIRSEEYEGAGEMVSSLAKFFRISLSQGKDMIPLSKELEHATSYLKIQNIRFKDKFDFHVEADPKLMKYLIPKLSIQPLLENAIYHGMEGMYDDGEIIISVYEEEGNIKIDIADNGLGMSEEKLDYIMHNKVVSSKRGSGIGVRNVNERIQLIYGKQYGISIISELDEGTTATITIPKMEETDETE